MLKMGKDAPCSSKTKINGSNSCSDKHSSRKRKMNDEEDGTSNGQTVIDKDPLIMNKNSKTCSASINPLIIKRNNNEKRSPSPQPCLVFDDPPPSNPIADQVSEKDFQDLLTYKDIPSDADSVRLHLQNELSKDRLLPRNQKERKRYTAKHITDKLDDLANANVKEDDNGNTVEIIQENGDKVDDDKIVEEIPQEMPTPSITKVTELLEKEKIAITVSISTSTCTYTFKETDSPQAKRRRIEGAETPESRSACNPLMEVQNNIERNSLSRDIGTPMSNCSGQSENNNENENTVNTSELEASTSKEKKGKRGRGRKRKRGAEGPKEPKPPVVKREKYWFLKEIINPESMVLKTGKKWTFLSAQDKSKVAVNPKTGLLLHPYRQEGKPEPFSKESAKYCFKYSDTKPEYTKEEKDYWKKVDLGPPPHDYVRKDIDGRPRKAVPTKEYYRRICGGRPRSYSSSSYTDYEPIYAEKTRLDKPKRKMFLVIPIPGPENKKQQFSSRRSRSAERLPCSREQLTAKYMMRQFNVPNVNMESQTMFSFLRKYEKGKFFQTFSVFWAEYHKLVELRCQQEGKEFKAPTIWTVVPYEYKRLSEAEEAKIAPESSKMNLKPWVNDCAERLLELFKYDVKPIFPVIQPTNEELIKHPLINASAKSKLKQIAYETFTLKQYFLNLCNGSKDAAKIWKKTKAILYETRILENQYFGIEGINDLLPKQYRAKTVSQIPDEQRIFLNDQNSWMYEQMIEIRIEEDERRRREEEKQRKAESRKLAKQAASGILPTPSTANKRKANDEEQEGGKRQRNADDHIEVEVASESAKTPVQQFSPELTASYQNESTIIDQSVLSDTSASENRTILEETWKMESEKEEITFKLPEISAHVAYNHPQIRKYVCEPFFAKAATKEKAFVEATFKVPRQKEKAKITVPIKENRKMKAQIVVSSKTTTADLEFKKEIEEEKAVKIVEIPNKEECCLTVSEPTYENVEADISLVAPSIHEQATDVLPKIFIMPTEKVSFTLNITPWDEMTADQRMESRLQYSRQLLPKIRAAETRAALGFKDVEVQKKAIRIKDMELPLSYNDLMKMAVNDKVKKIPPVTKYMSMKDAFSDEKTLQAKQELKQRNAPYYAFDIGRNTVINCGKVGKNKNHRQAVISGDNICKLYDYKNGEWECRQQLTATNILLFDAPFGTRRSQIGQKCYPSKGDYYYEFVVFRHEFGTLTRSDGSTRTISCFYTALSGKLILLFDKSDKYLFDLIWAPHLYYFTFRTCDNIVFEDVVLECYNVMFDTVNPPTPLSIKDLDEDNIFYIRRKDSKRSDNRRSHSSNVVASQKSSSGSAASSTSDKPGSSSDKTTSTPEKRTSTSTSSTNEKKRKKNEKRDRQIFDSSIRIKNLIDHNNSVFDSNDPIMVIHKDALKNETLKHHQRLSVTANRAFMMKEHKKLIMYYARIFEAKIREFTKINDISTEKLIDFPISMVKLATTLLFTDEKDDSALKTDDEKVEDKYRTFMGNIVAVSLCDAMRILTSLFTQTTPSNLNNAILDFHSGERFEIAASRLFYGKPEPDWTFLDNALALSIFEYSKDTSTLTFFFVRHLINSFKYSEFLEEPDKIYKSYYSDIIDYRSPFYYAERIVNDTMSKFYKYISNLVHDLPEFPPPNMIIDLIPKFTENSQLPRSITFDGNTFNFKFEYNLNTFKLNTIIPAEMFIPENLSIIPLEIQCQDSDGNDYFMDPTIPRWIFVINNIIIISPTTYRILYHTCQFAHIYLFPFDNINVPFFEQFRRSNGKLNFYSLLKSGMPIKVVDICTQPYLHGNRPPFDQSLIIGAEEAREWLKTPSLLKIDYDSGLLHLTWKTICTILCARNEHGLLSKDDSIFQSISTDLMRRFRLHEFELEKNLKMFIPNPPQVPSPAFIPLPNLPYKK